MISLLAKNIGSLIIESKEELSSVNLQLIGKVVSDEVLTINNQSTSINKLLAANTNSKIFSQQLKKKNNG
jgi:phosphoribosylformylglycinamidine synthase